MPRCRRGDWFLFILFFFFLQEKAWSCPKCQLGWGSTGKASTGSWRGLEGDAGTGTWPGLAPRSWLGGKSSLQGSVRAARPGDAWHDGDNVAVPAQHGGKASRAASRGSSASPGSAGRAALGRGISPWLSSPQSAPLNFTLKSAKARNLLDSC